MYKNIRDNCNELILIYSGNSTSKLTIWLTKISKLLKINLFLNYFVLANETSICSHHIESHMNNSYYKQFSDYVQFINYFLENYIEYNTDLHTLFLIFCSGSIGSYNTWYSIVYFEHNGIYYVCQCIISSLKDKFMLNYFTLASQVSKKSKISTNIT